MEQKTFSIYRKDDSTKMQIGKDVFILDRKERLRLLNCLDDVKSSKFLFPNKLYTIAIMYDNGLVAVIFSIGKMDLGGSKYLISTYSRSPSSTNYDMNIFMINGVDTISGYILALSPGTSV